MPLEKGSSKEVISNNIAIERRAGKKESQAAAIAYSEAGEDATLNWASGNYVLSPTQAAEKIIDPATIAPGAKGVSGVDAAYGQEMRKFHRQADLRGAK